MRFLLGKVPSPVHSYAQAYNLATGRSGVLFESRYQLIHVESDEYLHTSYADIFIAIRYDGGLVPKPEEWVYSNYLDRLGQPPGTLVDHSFIEGHFGSVERYRAYVASYLIGEVVLPAGLGGYLARVEGI